MEIEQAEREMLNVIKSNRGLLHEIAKASRKYQGSIDQDTTLYDLLDKLNQAPSSEQLEAIERWLAHGLPTKKISTLRLLIDTNQINVKGQLIEMNQLEQWANEEVISIYCSDVNLEELKTYRPGLYKAAQMLSMGTFANDEQEAEFQQIKQILHPNGWSQDTKKANNQKNDVWIVFVALKYHLILITNDGASKTQPEGILGKATELEKLGVQVVSSQKAMILVQDKILERDQMAKQFCKETGVSVPFLVA